VTRVQDITVCLVGSEQHKARPDLSDDSGFWLRVEAEHAAPFVDALKASPESFQGFVIEHRVGRQIRSSTLMAQIVKLEKADAEIPVLIRPDHSI
jgi:hypothetical protein